VGLTVSGTTQASCSERALRCLGQLPPFSPILNRLIATLANENVSFADVAEQIEKDTVLAGNVLRAVNSAMFGRRGTINSVRHAVALLGFDRLRNTALSLSIPRIWNQNRVPADWPARAFNLHSVATGLLADMLAQRVPVSYPEGAFVAGLLHDIGKLLFAIALHEEVEAVRLIAESGACNLIEAEMETIGVTHAEMSGIVLERWNLPPPIRQAVRLHHRPFPEPGEALQLWHLVHAADAICCDFGTSVPGVTAVPAGSGQAAIKALAIEEAAPQLLEEFRTEFDAMRALF
jgi:HD-like signal output (HDOD) protein